MADRFVGHIPMGGTLRRDAGGVNTRMACRAVAHHPAARRPCLRAHGPVSRGARPVTRPPTADPADRPLRLVDGEGRSRLGAPGHSRNSHAARGYVHGHAVLLAGAGPECPRRGTVAIVLPEDSKVRDEAVKDAVCDTLARHGWESHRPGGSGDQVRVRNGDEVVSAEMVAQLHRTETLTITEGKLGQAGFEEGDLRF